jgi:DNA/RNA endonuclease YhcR with UshA esterase domain
MVNERGLKNAFKKIKTDILQLQGHYLEIAGQQAEIARELQHIRDALEMNSKTQGCPVPRSDYVASKTGKKFHVSTCPYAKNIKAKTRLKFDSKENAKSEGYEPCECVE